MKSLSHIQLFATPWTVAYQAPPSMGFSRQECWSGVPFPSPGDLPDPGIEPGSPALRADALPFELPGKPSKIKFIENYLKITFKRKSRVKILHNFSEKIAYGKNANYLITLNLNSQKAGSYKCLLVTEFFLSLS